MAPTAGDVIGRDAPSMAPGAVVRHGAGRPAEPLLSVLAAALVLGAFFLPWMSGSGPFDLRSFSGFDFARLVRNFEIASESSSSTAGIRSTAIAFYLVPALAANAAALRLFEAPAGLARALVGWSHGVAAVYIIALHLALLFLSVVPLNDFEGAVGRPSWGFAASLAGAAMLAWLSRRALRSPSVIVGT